MLTVACIQTNSGPRISANIAAIEALLKESLEHKPRLVALPENAFLMDEPKAQRESYTMETHPGVIAAREWAFIYNVWILVGSVAIAPEADGGKWLNRSLLIAPSGEIRAEYDKIHLFDVEVGDGQTYRESARFAPGNKLVVAKFNPNPSPFQGEDKGGGVGLGMSICYDVRFPHLYRHVARAGAEILAVPAAFTRMTGAAHWHVLLRARAIETGCFVIAPAQCGMHPGGRETFGHSLIVDPWGTILAEGSADTPGIIWATLDMDLVTKTRSRIPSLMLERKWD